MRGDILVVFDYDLEHALRPRILWDKGLWRISLSVAYDEACSNTHVIVVGNLCKVRPVAL
jgi:hypothetical protein